MDCYELIDGMLFCSGEQQRYGVTSGDSLASPATPDACSGVTAGQQRYEVTGQKVPDRVQKFHERLASVAAGGVKQAGMGYLLTEKQGVISRSLMRGWCLCFSRSRPKNNQGLLPTSTATRLSGTQQCHLRAEPSLWHVLSTADGSVDHN